MATLSALKFGTLDGAVQALTTLQGLQKQQLIQIQDAAIVTWPQGAKKPKTRQTHSIAAAGALSGAFWGHVVRAAVLRAVLRPGHWRGDGRVDG